MQKLIIILLSWFLLSKTVHNTESPYDSIHWCYSEAANFQDGNTLDIMHQGRNVTCNLTVNAEVKLSEIYSRMLANSQNLVLYDYHFFFVIGRHTREHYSCYTKSRCQCINGFTNSHKILPHRESGESASHIMEATFKTSIP
jgi:hypothetical protein